MKNFSVEDLRKSGYKVRVAHKRFCKFDYSTTLVIPTLHGIKGDSILPRGGITQVDIRTPDGEELFGEAKCSDKDNYNKSIGLQIAIGRAMNSKVI
jgi:hypothetical protein